MKIEVEREDEGRTLIVDITDYDFNPGYKGTYWEPGEGAAVTINDYRIGVWMPVLGAKVFREVPVKLTDNEWDNVEDELLNYRIEEYEEIQNR